jgi:hypothetical protein
MPLDDFEFRPITFQGVRFPPTLMGIAVLAPVLGAKDRELAAWLTGLPACRGFTRKAPAEYCARCARLAMERMRELRWLVIAELRAQLEPRGIHPEAAYLDWMQSLQRIADLSAAAREICVWSAPWHPRDSQEAEAATVRWIEARSRQEPDTGGNPGG